MCCGTKVSPSPQVPPGHVVPGWEVSERALGGSFLVSALSRVHLRDIGMMPQLAFGCFFSRREADTSDFFLQTQCFRMITSSNGRSARMQTPIPRHMLVIPGPSCRIRFDV